MFRTSLVFTIGLLCTSGMAAAQDSHVHSAQSNTSSSTLAGEAGYGAIAEIVRILQADPKTDWSRVDLEKLRMHLADMHEVTINAAIKQTGVPGGIEAEVTGSGRAIVAIKRMAGAHAQVASAAIPYSAEVTELENGARIRLIARDGSDKEIQKLRGLGFIGWLTLDDHHAPHHLMMARGTSNSSH